MPCAGGGELRQRGLRGAAGSHGERIPLAGDEGAEPQEEEEETLSQLEEKSLLVVPLVCTETLKAVTSLF